MKKIIIILAVVILVSSCTKSNNSMTNSETSTTPENSVVETTEASPVETADTSSDSVDEMQESDTLSPSITDLETAATENPYDDTNPMNWDLFRQSSVYSELFEKEDIEQIKEFYTFCKNMGQYHHGEMVYLYNPLNKAIVNGDTELFIELATWEPKLLEHGNYNMSDYSVAPIIEAVSCNRLDIVDFILSQNVHYPDSTWIAGSRMYINWPINPITFATKPGMQNLLLIKYNDYAIFSEPEPVYARQEVNIYNEIGIDKEIIGTIPMNYSFYITKTTYFKVDDSQWGLGEFDNGLSGWVPLTYIGRPSLYP